MKSVALKTSAVLTLLSAAACLSSSELPGNSGKAAAFQHKPSRSNASSKPPKTIRQAIQMEPSTRKSERRKTKIQKKRTPTVDSSLLRFLSQQAKLKEEQEKAQQLIQQQQQLQQQTPTQQYVESVSSREENDITGSKYEINNNENDVEYIVSSDEFKLDSALEYQLSPVPNLLEHTAAFSQDTWIFDYNSRKVADLLDFKSEGDLEYEIAQLAGDSVQSVAIARTARRRIRTFLKARDQVWESSNSEDAVEEGKLETIMEEDEDDDVLVAAGSISSSSNVEEIIDLMMENGLNVKDIAEVLIHSPGIALMRPKPVEGAENKGETLQETLDRVFSGVLMSELKLRKYDARKIIRGTPGLLTKKGSKAAQDIVTLMSRLGVSSNSIARDKNTLPRLLSRSPEAVFRLVAFLASDAIRMPMNQIGPLLRRSICSELLDAVAPVPWMEKKGYFNLSPIHHAFHVESRLEQHIRNQIVNDLYRNMSKTAWTLRHEIGNEDLGKVIAAYPSVLLLDAETQILPMANYLMQELGIWEDDLPKVLQLYPILLGMEIE